MAVLIPRVLQLLFEGGQSGCLHSGRALRLREADILVLGFSESMLKWLRCHSSGRGAKAHRDS